MIAFHSGEEEWCAWTDQMVPEFKQKWWIQRIQTKSVLRWIFHNCLPRKLMLRAWRSNKPKPLYVLSKQIDFQATKAEVLRLMSPIKRKFLQMLTMFLITMSGIRKILSQNWTFPNRTDRTSSNWQAYVKCLPFQP
jgi:hypothetical protein